MDSEIDSILKVVNTYAEELGLANSFTAYLDRSGDRFKGDEGRCGILDIDNLRIVLNPSALNNELFDEYAAAVISYFQLPAHMMDSARAYERREYDEIRVDSDTMKELINNSMLLPGICKKVELDIINRLDESAAYDFTVVRDELIEEIIKSEKEIGDFTDDDWHEIDMSKPSFIEFNRGYRILEKLQADAAAVGPDYESRILRASLILAAESQNFDTEFARLVKDYSMDDIFVKSRFMSIGLSSDSFEQVKSRIYEGRVILGEKENVTVREIKPNIKFLLEYIRGGGYNLKESLTASNILSGLNATENEEDIIDQETKKEIRELWNGLETFADGFGETKRIWLK